MTPERSIFPEIQGLRAVAVVLVVVFHIWPAVLPGGYVGVDVFFVISGYLITGLLARMAMRDGRISLLDFYSRRARRLLPAATAVLAASLIGMPIFLPEARWQETATQIAASALYVENWVLAWLAVDYLGAENASSPVQHYWSLSIEEQFYFVWPLLMIVAILAARRVGIPLRRAFTVALALVFAGSLATSVLLTAEEPAKAYFVTHTRMWELALGGLLALSVHRFHAGAHARAAMAIAGLAAIAWSAIVYSPATAFPGTAALLPTVGTVLVIMAGDIRLSLFRGLNNTLLIYVGDRSYSIYLWHWPLITFYAVNQERIGLVDGVGLIALTLAISHLSYDHIEQRFRHARGLAEVKPLGYGLASIAACVLASGAVQYSIGAQANPALLAGDPRYPGPAALFTDAPVPESVEVIPALARLKQDLPVVYKADCHQGQKSAEALRCVLGDLNGTKTMVVAGDSHAAQWIPALEKIARERGWKLVTFTKSACPFARAPVTLRDKLYRACVEWGHSVADEVKQIRPDFLFTSQSRYGGLSDEQMIAALHDLWSELSEHEVQVVVIEDTPWMWTDPGDCLSNDQGSCRVPRDKALLANPLSKAASTSANVRHVDLTDGICGPDYCEMIVGNMIAWRDSNHLTATYAEALAPFLAQEAGLPAPIEGASALAAEANGVERISAILSCGGVGESKPFKRAVKLERDGDEIALRRGEWSKQENHFDLWIGTIEGSTVTLAGKYREGPGGLKDASFSGSIDNGRLLLTGKRGLRECALTAEWSGPDSL